ncbi:MAG: DNA replication/repair protein RecF [Candidatus Sumerlaeia bacterium]
MHLEHLQVEKFRCLDSFEQELPKGRILIEGNNASGKTTLLEAIYYLVTGRSFRTRYDNDCIPWDAPGDTLSLIRGKARRANGDTCRLGVTLGTGLKAVRIDGKPLKQLAGLWGKLRAVLFTPDDLQLIKGAPGERRRYLDVALSQIDPNYIFYLQRYNHAMRQRNALLKRTDLTDRQMHQNVAPWDDQLAENGAPVMKARHDFIMALEPRAAQIYWQIVAHTADSKDRADEVLHLQYQSSIKMRLPDDLDKIRANILKHLGESTSEDRRRGQTGVGPHRDDMGVLLSRKPTRDFGSQGQIRSAVLALTLAEIEEMESRTGEAPLVLLDDLASELDPLRKAKLLELLQPHWQNFMTTTRRSDFPDADAFDLVITLP